MTEEEYFRKNYPVSCYGDKPLSPYWDFFQDGVEFGERQSEKKIEELEKENANLKDVIEGYKKIVKWCDKCDKHSDLEEELKKWKDEWLEQVQKATDEGYARTLQTIQLSKAKELLKGWLGDFYNPKAFYQQRAELVEQSEQFLKDSEVEK